MSEECRNCGSTECDGLNNCPICGEDMDCTEELCDKCQRQKEIDEEF